MKRNEDSFGDIQDNIKCSNYMGPRRRREKGCEKVFEKIIIENFLNMGKEIAIQVQEAQRVPYRINPKRNTPRHILIKLMKNNKKKNIENIKGGATNNI